MHHELHTDIDIGARPEVVWTVLTDLDRYADWNPFIVSASGKVRVGEQLTNKLRSPGGRVMTFTPTVTAVEPAKTFEWLGRFAVPGLFDGRHRFELHALPDGGTRLVHTEQLQGLLVRALRRSLDTHTKQNFEEMNAALKTRAEAMALAVDPDPRRGPSDDPSDGLGHPEQHTPAQGSASCS